MIVGAFALSLLSRESGVPVAPHVGDMGEIHQHLVLFNHIALAMPALFLNTSCICAIASCIRHAWKAVCIAPLRSRGSLGI